MLCNSIDSVTKGECEARRDSLCEVTISFVYDVPRCPCQPRRSSSMQLPLLMHKAHHINRCEFRQEVCHDVGKRWRVLYFLLRSILKVLGFLHRLRKKLAILRETK